MAKVNTVLVPWEEASDFGLPERQYIFKVSDVEVGETQKGDTQIILTYLVLAPKKHKGKKLKQFYAFVPAGLANLRKAVRALLRTEVPSRADKLELDKLIGKTVKGEVKNTSSNGKTFSNIVLYEPYPKEEEPGPDTDVDEVDPGDYDERDPVVDDDDRLDLDLD